MSLFVDTSIWYAAADSSDASNARAKAILKSGEVLLTTDHVLVETWRCSDIECNAGRRSDSGKACEAGWPSPSRSAWRIWNLRGKLDFLTEIRIVPLLIERVSL